MNDEGLSISRVRTELLSGLTVALALIPEAVAFAFVAGVHPLVGLYAAFLVGLVTAVLRRLTGCERRRTNSSDHCSFEFQWPTSVRPRRSG